MFKDKAGNFSPIKLILTVFVAIFAIIFIDSPMLSASRFIGIYSGTSSKKLSSGINSLPSWKF